MNFIKRAFYSVFIVILFFTGCGFDTQKNIAEENINIKENIIQNLKIIDSKNDKFKEVKQKELDSTIVIKKNFKRDSNIDSDNLLEDSEVRSKFFYEVCNNKIEFSGHFFSIVCPKDFTVKYVLCKHALRVTQLPPLVYGMYIYLIIFVTTPAPTVLPPSRIAKRIFSSIATGIIRLILRLIVSPGITISVPSGSSTSPVTSVVRI